VLGAAAGTLVHAARRGEGLAGRWRGAASVRALGFGVDEALSARLAAAFSGYRLLQEAAALPQRCCSSSWPSSRRGWRRCRQRGRTGEFLQRGEAALRRWSTPQPGPVLHAGDQPVPKRWTASSSAPALGLPRGAGPHAAHGLRGAQHRSVTGFGTGAVAQQEFLPLYATYHDALPTREGRHARLLHGAARAAPAVLEAEAAGAAFGLCRRGGLARAGRSGPMHPNRQDVRQLSVSAWVTNRDLPTLLAARRAARPRSLCGG
jgi:type VI secretion system protein ImpG